MFSDPNVLTLLGFNTQSCPLVFDSPHSGTIYPKDFNHNSNFELVRMGEDTHVHELFGNCVEKGCILLQAEFPRSYIDPNRSETDFLKTELAEDPKNLCDIKFVPTIKSELGIGLIWTRVPPNGEKMYAEKIKPQTLMHRVIKYHRPYHAVLRKCLEKTFKEFNKFYHINCHSMSDKASAMSSQPKGTKRPDFVIGDRDGTTCSPILTNIISDFLTTKGFYVTINDPYKGVELVKAYSNPSQNCHSIQIEINRSLYMDEITREKNSKFQSTKSLLTDLTNEIKNNLEKGFL